MKTDGHLTALILFAAFALLGTAKNAMAKDPVQVDPKHYHLEFENDQVRVLRITYGPHELSVMHEHPASVVISLTDQDVKFSFPNGNSEERHLKAGQAVWHEAGSHLPENLSDKPLEAILVELKK